MLPASLSARWLSKEFVESTAAGGAFTVMAYMLMLILFVLELSSYLGDSPVSVLALDGPVDERAGMRINFDIDLYSIECHNLKIAVIDPLDDGPVRSLDRDYTMRSVEFIKDAQTVREVHKRVTESDEDVEAERERRRLEQEDGGKDELDSDWASSHDGFKHQHFDHVIQYHDFTIINFFAEWCGHCRQFAPLWNQIAEEVHQQEYRDNDGHKRVVKMIRVNCVEYRTLCRHQGINAFPTIRAYRSDGSFVNFEDRRSREHIMDFVGVVVKRDADGFRKHHHEFQTGCNVLGHLMVPKIPAYLELFAGGDNHALDPTMTNVSHFVRHLSFSDPLDSQGMFGNWRATWGLPRDQRKHTHPLDGQKFIHPEFHQTYEHHLKVVSTQSSYGQTYQFSNYGRIAATADKNEVPQARFNFDIDTFAIKILDSEQRLYQFGTSTMAILGGTFVMMKLLSSGTRTVAKAVVKSVGPQKSTRSAMNRQSPLMD